MKRKFKRGLGGVALVAAIVAGFMVPQGMIASAEEAVSPGLEDMPIFDGPGFLPPPNNFGPAQPPREGLPGNQPSPEPSEIPIYNVPPEPTTPPIQGPHEEPIGGSTTLPLPDSHPAPEVVQPAEPTSKPAVETPPVEAPKVDDPEPQTPAVVSKPVVISAPVITVSSPLAVGSKTITPAAKTSLAKTAATVKASNKPVSIAVKTTGTTVAKATAQAQAIVSELKKRGVAAVTVIKRVGKKTSVSILVTKKKP
jgi:hypothetical protein